MASVRSHAFSILLAAAIFGVMGYSMFTWQYQTATPPMILLLKWTLRIGAVVFAFSGLLVLLRFPPGLLLYGASGVVAAAVCLVVTGWEVTSPYRSGPGPLILIVLAAWTGYTGVEALRHGLAILGPPPAGAGE